MTDDILELRLRHWYRAEADSTTLAPAGLRDSIMAIPATDRQTRNSRARQVVLLAAAAVLAFTIVGGLLAAGTNLLRVRNEPTPLPSMSIVPPTPSPTPSPSPTALASPSASTTGSPIVLKGSLLAVYHLDGDVPEILTIDPDTGERLRIGTMPVALRPLGENVFAATVGPRDAGIEWSTDRRLITISLIGDGSSPRAQFDVLSKEVRQIAVRDEAYVAPDGRLAAILDSEPPAVRVVNLSGNVVGRLPLPPEGAYFSRINWAPDSAAVIVGGFAPIEPASLANPDPAHIQVFAATVGGPGFELIVPLNGDPVQQFGGSSDTQFGIGQMSADLSGIVVNATCGESAPRSCSAGLRVIDVRSGEITQVTHDNNDLEALWSPDGTRVAFTRFGGATRGIWVMNADGSGLTQLTAPDRPLNDHDIAWSPDGSAIVFTRGQIGEGGRLGDVYVLPSSGGAPQLVISDSIADW